jgi:hypothetical protein
MVTCSSIGASEGMGVSPTIAGSTASDAVLHTALTSSKLLQSIFLIRVIVKMRVIKSEMENYCRLRELAPASVAVYRRYRRNIRCACRHHGLPRPSNRVRGPRNDSDTDIINQISAAIVVIILACIRINHCTNFGNSNAPCRHAVAACLASSIFICVRIARLAESSSGNDAK